MTLADILAEIEKTLKDKLAVDTKVEADLASIAASLKQMVSSMQPKVGGIDVAPGKPTTTQHGTVFPYFVPGTPTMTP
jgi:hypothetical protein